MCSQIQWVNAPQFGLRTKFPPNSGTPHPKSAESLCAQNSVSRGAMIEAPNSTVHRGVSNAIALEVVERRMPQTPAPSSVDERITAALTDVDRPAPFSELRARCRVRTATLYERLAALIAAGRLDRSEEGYRLARQADDRPALPRRRAIARRAARAGWSTRATR